MYLCGIHGGRAEVNSLTSIHNISDADYGAVVSRTVAQIHVLHSVHPH